MSKPYRMLIIDDSDAVLSTLKGFFLSKNYDVVATENAVEGLRLLEAGESTFDVLITDLVMPDISGIGIISIVKEKFPDISVVAMTGWGENPEMLAKEAKADAVVEKPFRLEMIENIILGLLKKKDQSKRGADKI